MEKITLTTTSYAILGLLALRSWTTYELAKQMQRTLHYFWPRAESRLYEEPKNLVAQGFATAEKSYLGKRSSTIYSITPAGRQALEEWLSTPPASPVLEVEGIVRVFLADLGTKKDLLQTIAQMQQAAESMQAQGAAIAKEYLTGQAPFQERAYLNAFMFDFLWRYSQSILDWVEATRAEVAGWQDLSPENKTGRALQLFARPESKLEG